MAKPPIYAESFIRPDEFLINELAYQFSVTATVVQVAKVSNILDRKEVSDRSISKT